MTIYCKVCNYRIDSKSGDEVKDTRTVLEGVSRHLLHSHKQEGEALKSDCELLPAVVSTYLLIKHYVRVPPEEVRFQRNFDENEAWLASIFSQIPVTKGPN